MQRTVQGIVVNQSRDPSVWDSEVIKALSSRLPGGSNAVTLPCMKCKSVFYPCLCTKDDIRVVHKRGLRPPKIVQISELRRLDKHHHKPIGHLQKLAAFVDCHPACKDLLQVCGAEDADEFNRDSNKYRLTSGHGQVLWREGDTYVVTQFGSVPEIFSEEFTAAELANLADSLEEGTEGRLFLGSEASGVKTVTVAYQVPHDSFGDLELGKTSEGWEVVHVRDNGLAHSKGIRVGQKLLRFEHVQPGSGYKLRSDFYAMQTDLVDCKWVESDLSQMNPPWSVLSSDDRNPIEPSAEALIFPCKLAFDLLVPGSEALTVAPVCDGQPCAAQNLTSAVLEEILRNNEAATITFQRWPKERLRRTKLFLGHVHECDETHVNCLSDHELFELWIVKAGMRPKQLGFVFKKLSDLLKAEVQNCENRRTEYFDILVSKCSKCLQLQDRIDELCKATPETQKIRRQKEHLDSNRNELRSTTLKRGEDKIAKWYEASPTAQLIKTLERELDSCETDIQSLFESMPLESVKELVQEETPARQRLNESLRLRQSESTKATHTDTALEFLKEQVDAYTESLRKTSAKVNTFPGHTFVVDEHNLEDGKVYRKEFERMLALSGIYWLTTSQFTELFESLDKDKSGKLTIGELHDTATRVLDLVRRIEDFLHQKNRVGVHLSHREFVTEFRRQLTLGEDLVGSKHKPLIPDSSITASSYLFNRAEHGFNQMWRSRLDSEELAWVAERKENDPQPWLQWEFVGPRTIQAVATRGRPDIDAWVTRFSLKFSKFSTKEASASMLDEWEDYPGGTLDGNTNHETPKYNTLDPAIVGAVRVRIYPSEWYGRSAALRASVFGYVPIPNAAPPPTGTFHADRSALTATLRPRSMNRPSSPKSSSTSRRFRNLSTKGLEPGIPTNTLSSFVNV